LRRRNQNSDPDGRKGGREGGREKEGEIIVIIIGCKQGKLLHSYYFGCLSSTVLVWTPRELKI
jgi:hypothetical protein